jgi:hypothetical protein
MFKAGHIQEDGSIIFGVYAKFEPLLFACLVHSKL